MIKKNFLTKSLFFGALSLALGACSNAELIDGPDVTSGSELPQLSIALSTPASESVIVRGMQTRAVGDIILDEADEAAVNTLSVFLFKQNGGDTDADYKYYSTTDFVAADLGDGTGGSKTCSIDIEKDLMGSKVKIALLANDKSSMYDALTKDVTTLADFKAALATAAVSDGNKADVLVGGETDKSFPMSVVVSVDKALDTQGADIDAILVRNVARLDIFNYTPNLTITGVNMANVNNKSYLFSAATAVNVPADAAKLSLLPLKEFSDKLTAGLAYQTPAQDTEESARLSNTHRTFYLYEQEVADAASSPEITIDYTLAVNGMQQPGSVTVQFQKTADKSFVNVVRNTLYRIKLGEGNIINTGLIKVMFETADWIPGADINSELDPSTEKN